MLRMIRKIKFSEGEYYHIYNRGVDKREIFMDKNDHERFVLLLEYANLFEAVNIRNILNQLNQGLPSVNRGETLVDIGAWCLMPNHFHLLVREKNDAGLSKFLSKLQTGYSMYFNKRHDRSGALFQGSFKAEHVDKDEYLKYLYSYIHLNPIKLIQSDWKDNGIYDLERAELYLEEYSYSSYLDYVGSDRKQKIILNKESFPEYFDNQTDFKKNIFEWLKFSLPRGDLGKKLST